MDKDKQRKKFFDDLATKIEETGQTVRFILGIDDAKEADLISESDIKEIPDLLPDLTGMDVLELACGTG